MPYRAAHEAAQRSLNAPLKGRPRMSVAFVNLDWAGRSIRIEHAWIASDQANKYDEDQSYFVTAFVDEADSTFK